MYYKTILGHIVHDRIYSGCSVYTLKVDSRMDCYAFALIVQNKIHYYYELIKVLKITEEEFLRLSSKK